MQRFLAAVFVLVSLVAAYARADQCQAVSPVVADRAVAAIRAAHRRVLPYCAPCEEPLPAITAAFVPSSFSSNGSGVVIDGREVDLAYTYLEVAPNVFENIALRTGCEASDVPEVIRFVGGAARVERFGAPPASLAPLGWGHAPDVAARGERSPTDRGRREIRPLPPG